MYEGEFCRGMYVDRTFPSCFNNNKTCTGLNWNRDTWLSVLILVCKLVL